MQWRSNSASIQHVTFLSPLPLFPFFSPFISLDSLPSPITCLPSLFFLVFSSLLIFRTSSFSLLSCPFHMLLLPSLYFYCVLPPIPSLLLPPFSLTSSPSSLLPLHPIPSLPTWSLWQSFFLTIISLSVRTLRVSVWILRFLVFLTFLVLVGFFVFLFSFLKKFYRKKFCRKYFLPSLTCTSYFGWSVQLSHMWNTPTP